MFFLDDDCPSLDSNVMLNVSQQDRDDNVWRAKLGEMAFGGHHLNNGLTTKVPVQVLRHGHWNCKILGALNNVAWDTNKWEEVAHITLEDRLGNTECNVWTYIEECPAKFLNCH
jgi:hypothetical protein